MTIRVEGLRKAYGAFTAVDNVSFDVPSGALVALLGPSGSGKSTVLRMIAGLDETDGGSVWLDGVRVDGLHARERRVGFVFQSYALFRHMSILDNVAFGLVSRGDSRSAARKRALELLGLVGLHGFGERKPAALSGGQRQRVALARALAPDPRVLLLDEPFSAVDARVREELRTWLRRFHDERGITTLFVTHDQEEAFQIADEVLILHGGRVEQKGKPLDVIDRPSSELVARFVGDTNVLDAVVIGGRARRPGFDVAAPDVADGTAVNVIVRAWDVVVHTDPTGPALVKRSVVLGDRVRVEAAFDDGLHIVASLARSSLAADALAAGTRVRFTSDRARVFPARTDDVVGVGANV